MDEDITQPKQELNAIISHHVTNKNRPQYFEEFVSLNVCEVFNEQYTLSINKFRPLVSTGSARQEKTRMHKEVTF